LQVEVGLLPIRLLKSLLV